MQERLHVLYSLQDTTLRLLGLNEQLNECIANDMLRLPITTSRNKHSFRRTH